MPRKRREISKSDRDWAARFALRLRALLEDRGWTSADVAERLTAAGLAGDSIRTVDSWLASQRLPQLKDLEQIGAALGLDDYRLDLLPEPLKRTRKRSG